MHRCYCCDEAKITREQLKDPTRDKQFYCDDCNAVRNTNTAMFDFFADMIDKKIQKAIDYHEDSSYHQDI